MRDVSRRTKLLALAGSSLVAFVVLTVLFDGDTLGSGDLEVAERVAESLPWWLEAAARPFSWLGGWIGLSALGVALCIVLVRERAWLDLAFLLTAVLGSALCVALLKAWIDRPRPDVGSAVPLPTSASFPSGHATAGVAGLGACAVLAAERLESRTARAWLWSLTLVAGVGVGLSRIALNVHYVTDVVAGWCLGLAWLAACLLVRELFRSRG